MNSSKLNDAYQNLVNSFPELYSIIMVRDGQLIYEKYNTPASENKAFSIKSITKSIMNALVGIAIREDLIKSVDQNVLDLIETEPKKLFIHLEGVTIRHLLTMTHGIGVEENSTEMLDIWKSPNWVSTILNKPLVKKSGTQFLYSTCTTHILSALLTSITKVPASYFAHKMLLRPLGISKPIHWETDPQGINWGGTNMFLAPRILARIGQLYLADGIWNGQRLLPVGWVNESFTTQSEGWLDYATYGYLWWLSSCDGIDYAFASGYGGQYVYVIPKLKCVMVLTANSDIEISTMQSTTNVVVKDPSYLIRKFILEPAI